LQSEFIWIALILFIKLFIPIHSTTLCTPTKSTRIRRWRCWVTFISMPVHRLSMWPLSLSFTQFPNILLFFLFHLNIPMNILIKLYTVFKFQMLGKPKKNTWQNKYLFVHQNGKSYKYFLTNWLAQTGQW
jgi:hypothetical protein